MPRNGTAEEGAQRDLQQTEQQFKSVELYTLGHDAFAIVTTFSGRCCQKDLPIAPGTSDLKRERGDELAAPIVSLGVDPSAGGFA